MLGCRERGGNDGRSDPVAVTAVHPELVLVLERLRKAAVRETGERCRNAIAEAQHRCFFASALLPYECHDALGAFRARAGECSAERPQHLTPRCFDRLLRQVVVRVLPDVVDQLLFHSRSILEVLQHVSDATLGMQRPTAASPGGEDT